MKLFSSLVCSLAGTLQLRTVNAGWEEVESVLAKMESVTRQLRDELESAYASRCDPDTIKGCAKTNYHDCASKFPDPICGLVNDNKDPSQTVCQCGCE